jgi:DNA-binding transcriptional ArsR family regulator
MAHTKTELKIEIVTLKKAAGVFRAINNNLRQQILKLIHKKGKITVTEIYVKLRLEQSVTSQHLSILRQAGFVNVVRDGQRKLYSINYDRLNQVHETAEKLLRKI